MSAQWKIAFWLGLLNDLNENLTDSDNSNPRNRSRDNSSGDPNRRRPERRSLNLPSKPNNKKSLATKVLVVTAIIIAASLIFGNTSRYIDIKSIECDNEKLKIKLEGGGKDVILPKFADRYKYAPYASKVNITGNEDIYDIYLYPEAGRKVYFRASKAKVNEKDKGDKWTYSIGSNTYSRLAVCDGTATGGATCTCGTTGGTCTGKCCCCSSDKSCTCSSTGSGTNGCACCTFMSWIDQAILNVNEPTAKITPASVFFSLLPTLLYFSVFFFLARSAMKNQSMGISGPGGIFKIGQSLSKTIKFNLSFKDIGGLEEEKRELEEIVDYLRQPAKYKAMGARIPKGVMLYGPPGTGKTLLAKAVSGEAEVPFIEVAGSSFDDMYVGSGAKRVRDLFAKARKLAPCIVFIDEIDAVAGKRGNKFMGGGGAGAYDQTINQLLSEMDGFNTAAGMVIIAATNRLDSIDDAVLRPGRFDRHVQVNLPNIKDRVGILKLHASNKNLSSTVDLDDIARKTPGFSGAQLENVLNEAALLAVREDSRVITKYHIEEAIDRVMAGISKKSHQMCDLDRKMVAYHEAGHAIAGLYTDEGEVVEKVTIIPRGRAAGYMLSSPKKQETVVKRKDELLSIILTTLAGRASEEVFFGIDKISTGAANDLYKATNVARKMIVQLGMSKKLGLQQFEPSEGMENPYRHSYSEASAQLIDREVDEIISEQYQKAKDLLVEHRIELLLIVECLLLIETIDRNQIEFIHDNKKLPPEALAMKDKLRAEGKKIDLSPQSEKILVGIDKTKSYV